MKTQVASIENDARSRDATDVIMRLPQGKDVVIDAKITSWPMNAISTPKMTTPAKARYRNISHQ
ncbi:hypothetical protein ACLK17_23935 [Escherichia coli]